MLRFYEGSLGTKQPYRLLYVHHSNNAVFNWRPDKHAINMLRQTKQMELDVF